VAGGTLTTVEIGHAVDVLRDATANGFPPEAALDRIERISTYLADVLRNNVDLRNPQVFYGLAALILTVILWCASPGAGVSPGDMQDNVAKALEQIQSEMEKAEKEPQEPQPDPEPGAQNRPEHMH
jgi:hypothetical protein